MRDGDGLYLALLIIAVVFGCLFGVYALLYCLAELLKGVI